MTDVFDHDADTMSVRIDGGEPVTCDFEARAVTEPLIVWKVRYESKFFPDMGSTVDVELRLIPGVVVVGKGIITSVVVHPDADDLPRPPRNPSQPIWLAVVSGMGRLTPKDVTS